MFNYYRQINYLEKSIVLCSLLLCLLYAGTGLKAQAQPQSVQATDDQDVNVAAPSEPPAPQPSQAVDYADAVSPIAPDAVPAAPPLPPPGNGAYPNAQISGNQGNPPGMPNKQADPTTGNMFPSGAANLHTIVYVYRQEKTGSLTIPTDWKMVMTIAPATLPIGIVTQINGVLQHLNPGFNMLDGSLTKNAQATNMDIAAIENILAPYPSSSTMSIDGTSYKFIDSTVQGTLPTPNAGSFTGPLPTVRVFCKWLVNLGLVAATVWMIFAAWGVISGDKYAGSRVTGTAGGLILLLMAFTIWKVVQLNMTSSNTNDDRATLMTNPNAPLHGTVTSGLPTLAMPDSGAQAWTTSPRNSQSRSGVPVQPLYGQ